MTESCANVKFGGIFAPKAQFQLVAVCDVVDFECPPGISVCVCVGVKSLMLLLDYLGTPAEEIAKNEAT